MEKPTRPRKPKKENLAAPIQTLTDNFYPMERCYSGDEIRIIDEADMIWPYYDSCDTEEEKEAQEEFYDDNRFVTTLSLPVIMRFAEERNIPLEELQVEAYVPDREYGEYCILRWQRQLPNDVFQGMVAAHEAEKVTEKSRYEEALEAYAQAKEQYKIDKAAYDVFLAQEKLNALQGNS